MERGDAAAELRKALTRQTKAELVNALLELAQEDRGVLRQLTARFDVVAAPDELVAAMTGLEWQSPGGLIQMKLADGHQAIQPIAISRTKYNPDLKRVDLVDIQYFPAECVNPPPGVKSLDWIKGGMQGAKCN